MCSDESTDWGSKREYGCLFSLVVGLCEDFSIEKGETKRLLETIPSTFCRLNENGEIERFKRLFDEFLGGIEFIVVVGRQGFKVTLPCPRPRNSLFNLSSASLRTVNGGSRLFRTYDFK